MAPPTSGLSRTLQSLTLTKIREIEKQRKKYEDRKQEILTIASSKAGDQRELVAHLLSGVKEIIPGAATDPSLSNIRRWLDQSRFDASIPPEMLQSFEKQLRAKFETQSRKLSLADLYSHLMTEWMNPPTSTSKNQSHDDDGSEDSFEVLERQKERLQELCDKFESVVFEPLETDEVEIHKYISGLFAGEEDIKALNCLREKIRSTGKSMLAETVPFDKESLIWCIKGLLAEDLLSEEKQNVLQDFLKNELVLGEITDVLNMRFADLKSWAWEAEGGIPVMPRQQLNGKYRIWMDEDVLQAIFIHYIGIQWCVALKSALTQMVQSTPTWKWDQGEHMPQEERTRRAYYLPRTSINRSFDVNKDRFSQYINTFLLSQLPGTHESLYTGIGYDNDSTEDATGTPVKGSSIKQQLLRKLATEVLLHQSLHGEVAVVQSDLQWYATGLSHTTIFAIMKFVGFSEDWIAFFKKFLEAPLNMAPSSADGTSTGKPRIRKRGVPMAHAPEKLLGELVLFIMDHAVNKESGMLLYRLHDDLWLCGKPSQCAQAWKAMEKFTKVTGLEFNLNKTGFVYLSGVERGRDENIVKTLPTGPVTVGFLTLDPATSSWIIDQKQVDAHVTQLQKQLDGCDSVLSWIQTWNSCIGRFFSHTFGEPAFCFGRQHVDSTLETYERMQRILFNGKDGRGKNVTEHLKTMIATRFGVTDIPDAFLYLPEQLGGLGLRNPFVPFFLIREELTKDPKEVMKKFLEDEKEEYAKAKKEFEQMDQQTRRRRFNDLYSNGFSKRTPQIDERDTFMSMEAYTQWRESASESLQRVYAELLSTPFDEALWTPGDVTQQLRHLQWELPELKRLSSEKRWIVGLHAAEVFEKCGGLSMVEKSFLPLGVLTMMRQKKVTWQMVL
ncbi:hypothetical protein G7Y89_g1635 [Cudoniella acicularis]|uniref:Reverse transcriptase domain-containing protein n=1 Tax=Cudoniella acicularis TaxID=354080 RepID=A0A8H4RWK1_9HELO|nr:hypothetical protein G7Y89_g1635 [Cudoniella acicularis]